MHQISIIVDAQAREKSLRKKFEGIRDIEIKHLDAVLGAAPPQYAVFDIDLESGRSLLALKDWLSRRNSDAKAIFVTDKSSRLQHARACGIGATDVIHRPIDGQTVLTKLWGDVASLASSSSSPALKSAPGVGAAIDTLQHIFSSACMGGPIQSSAIEQAGDAVVNQVEAQGLTAWIETVRMHHSQTYQHCLIVTGLAVAFGQHIGVSHADRQRLSFAGMLHDIGKARIPLAILEKPGPLDADELAVMRNHPQYGIDALGTVTSLPAEMLDMVVHHHEYLDGSGYPHKLSGSEISDLVRIITIADVFGALIERRSYKPPLTGEAAYKILLDMGPKLDKDLVRAFGFAAKLGQQEANPG
jgi:putative nucleotidyltransferase with HDIG domain